MKTKLEIIVVRDNTTRKKPSTAIIIPQNLSSLIYRRWLLIDGNDKLLAEVKQRVLESGKPEKVLITETIN